VRREGRVGATFGGHWQVFDVFGRRKRSQHDEQRHRVTGYHAGGGALCNERNKSVPRGQQNAFANVRTTLFWSRPQLRSAGVCRVDSVMCKHQWPLWFFALLAGGAGGMAMFF